MEWSDAYLLTKEEQGERHTMISQNPDIGDVVPKSGGVRKVRFARQGGGKSGGVRVIYYNRLEPVHNLFNNKAMKARLVN